ncbi:MAG TPA: tlde1 domain-containing protein [Bradyrhizobium sp.]|uniref:tlde1 domain-containing protein n=1 Tax=Bradyrhizobium sp. TaxID=376 RepID=UPI002D7E1CEA|nr:tlde1 domain-containing protein [Bradyrhizobium sp.]HET7889538.1 tlde1 domain-containing protein [Bradyrhizobium sp.]
MTAQSLFIATAVIGLVVGCGWTVYANIFAASPYPELGSANYDAPVARRFASIAVRPIVRPEPPIVTEPETPAAEPTLSFLERFAAASPQGVAPAPVPDEPVRIAVAPKPEPLKLAEAPKTKEAAKETPKLPSKDAAKEASAKIQLASASPATQPDEAPKGLSKFGDMARRAKNAILSLGGEHHSITEKLWGKEGSRNPVLAYASADAGSVTGSVTPREQNPMLGGSPPYDRDTAVYDITAHTVYLPDGTKLEAHSGLGSNLDDPHSSRIRMRGVTPPHIYTLKPREALFHGVAALRLTPIGGEDAIFGREGLLAHTYMLGPNGDSNGCVSFRDYNAFLNAYRSGGIRKLAVVARVE